MKGPTAESTLWQTGKSFVFTVDVHHLLRVLNSFCCWENPLTSSNTPPIFESFQCRALKVTSWLHLKLSKPFASKSCLPPVTLPSQGRVYSSAFSRVPKPAQVRHSNSYSSGRLSFLKFWTGRVTWARLTFNIVVRPVLHSLGKKMHKLPSKIRHSYLWCRFPVFLLFLFFFLLTSTS